MKVGNIAGVNAVSIVNCLLDCRPHRRKSVTCVPSLCTRQSEWKPADASTTKCASNVASARTLSSKCSAHVSADAVACDQ